MLNTKPNLANPDEFYQALLEAHEGKSEAESQKINSRLILLLANHIGDMAVLEEALAAAVEPGA
jgi:5-carboxymethyl-2-hydroxymuconate isomerase